MKVFGLLKPYCGVLKPMGVPLCGVTFCFPGSCIVCAAIVLPDKPSEEWSPENKRKLRNRQPLVRFKPRFGRAVMVPLPFVPMVFPEHSYVCASLVSQVREGWGWGRIATLALNVPGGLGVGYSGCA